MEWWMEAEKKTKRDLKSKQHERGYVIDLFRIQRDIKFLSPFQKLSKWNQHVSVWGMLELPTYFGEDLPKFIYSISVYLLEL